MTLATADRRGRPSARQVLLRGIDARGLVFFTNRTSRKASELAENPRAALVLHWYELGRRSAWRARSRRSTRPSRRSTGGEAPGKSDRRLGVAAIAGRREPP